MPRMLVIPAETHPCDHSFLEETLAKNEDGIERTFLMRSRVEQSWRREIWHHADVVTFPRRSRVLPLAWLTVYLLDLRYAFHILRLATRERYDLIYVRDLTFPLFLAILLRPLFRWRVMHQKSFPHELRWFDERELAKYRLPWLFVLARRFEKPILDWLMGRADAVIPISETMAEELVEDGICRPDRSHPFGMGISDGVKSAADPPGRRPGEELKLIYLGTLAQSRRLDLMVEAVNIAAEELGVDVTLTVAGGTPEEVQRFEASVDNLSMQSRVEALGRVPRSDIFHLLARHHAGAVFIARDPRFWVASVTKLLESCAVGLPCVVTDTVAMHRPLAERTRSIILTDDSARAFADGIRELDEQWEELSRNALAAREGIIQDYSYDAARARMSSLCFDLIQD